MSLEIMGRSCVRLCFALQAPLLRKVSPSVLEILIALICGVFSEWSVTMPAEIKILTGSCVEIPCSFTHPPSHKPLKITWYSYSSTKYPVVYSERPEDVIQPFRGRTELTGDVKSGDCSLKISDVQSSMNEYHLYPWIDPDSVKHAFYHKTVELKVQGTPPEVQLIVKGKPKEGETLHISCTVVHTCPSSPPNLTFGDTRGDIQRNHTDLGQGYWEAKSTISFPAIASDQGREVACWVRHPGRQANPTLVEINVNYAPRSVHVSAENSTALEGGNVTLECRSDANPPASSFLWYVQRDGSVRALTFLEKSITVTDMQPDQSSFYCMAQSVLGAENSSSPFIITAEYKPSILSGSSCNIRGSVLRCWCKVRSLPSASVEWKVDGMDPHSALSDVNVFNAQQNHTLSGLLLYNMTVQGRTVTCRAYNAHGKEEHTLVIKAPPQNVYISQRPPRVLEGQFVTLSCLSDAFPAVLSYNWYQVQGDREVQLSQQSERLHLQVLDRHMGPYRCSALNEIGQSSSNSTVVHVDFAPVISSDSSCTLENGQVRCECVVESSPVAAVTWTALGLQSSRTTNTETQGYLKSTLTGHVESKQDHVITCHATNEQGHTSLQLKHKDSSVQPMSSLMAAGCGAAVIVALIVVVLYCIQRRRENQRNIAVEVELEDNEQGKADSRAPWF